MLVLNRATRTLVKQARQLCEQMPNTVVFVSSLLRPREIKMAAALAGCGWKIILLYKPTTPFNPSAHFDIAIRLPSDELIVKVAHTLRPRLFHVFSGAVDEVTLSFCRDKPGPLVIDLNDVFCPSLFNYLLERFEPTRECLGLADGLVSRDFQPKYANRLDGCKLPKHILWFPEYSWINAPQNPGAVRKLDPNEVHVVSIGTFTLESQNMYDSAYLQLARDLANNRIHFHIYPHWFYQNRRGSSFRFNQRLHFADFYALEAETPYFHLHQSLPIEQLALELPQYDFGLISGGSERLGQRLNLLTRNYMRACYSGRIADYLDARLPVLINPEVEFNYRLLKHYGAMVDLNGLFEANFRERLLKLKSDSNVARSVENAAQCLSLDKHAPRLAAFYDRVSADRSPQRMPLWVRKAARLPVIGDTVRRLAEDSEQASSLRQRNGELIEYNCQLKYANEVLRYQLRELRRESGRDGPQFSYPQSDRSFTKQEADALVGLLNWSEMSDQVEREQGYDELIRIMHLFLSHQYRRDETTDDQPSSAWKLLNRKNLDQLVRDGFRRFKRTVALNYFTFPIQGGDPQITELEALLDESECIRLQAVAKSLPDDPEFALREQWPFRYHLLLLSAYAQKRDTQGLLGRLEEPTEGSPVTVNIGGRRMSQDLVNSVLEYYSIAEGKAIDSARRVLEIGGGYGRDAFVLLQALPRIQYVMLDIPPAIYIAQRYLSSVFRDRPMFRVTDFTDFATVRDEFEAASIAFLLPHQFSLLPKKYFDLTINISSFGEMTRDQIRRYFAEIDRVTAGQFYTKQWCESRNPFDKLHLRERDYPVNPHWRKLYSRPCAAQASFFEALYDVGGER